MNDDAGERAAQRSGVFKLLSESVPDTGFSIDEVVQELYEFTPGDPAGRDRFSRLFAEGARIFGPGWEEADGPDAPGLDVAAFMERRRAMGGRAERELSRRTESYGDIAQVLSTFERTSEQGAERGLNSLHLRHDGARWWIVSLVWTVEDEERPLPTRYLKRR